VAQPSAKLHSKLVGIVPINSMGNSSGTNLEQSGSTMTIPWRDAMIVWYVRVTELCHFASDDENVMIGLVAQRQLIARHEQ